MKPFLSLNHPDIMFNCSQVDRNHSMAQGSYPYDDPFFAGSLFAYGPQAINQPQMFQNQPQILPQMLGLQSTRVPLPLDLAEDGPIYVNAKQYHGILRRRQSRAKLEAQNKLIKSRKPYLHESRHRHALNRVRGSGGRFLSTKQLEQCNAELTSSVHSGSDTNHIYPKKDVLPDVESHPSRTRENASSFTTFSDWTSLSSSSSIYRQPERMLMVNPSNLSGAPQCSGGLAFNGTKQHAHAIFQ